MFTGKISVRKLRRSEVSLKTVNDINDLLRDQHSEARKIDQAILLAKMQRSKVVVAWNDGDRIIGMGVLVKVDDVFSYSFASIHHFSILKGSDRLSIGKMIMDLLIDGVDDVSFIEASAWPDDVDLINLLTVSGFKPKLKLRYRRKVKVPKKI